MGLRKANCFHTISLLLYKWTAVVLTPQHFNQAVVKLAQAILRRIKPHSIIFCDKLNKILRRNSSNIYLQIFLSYFHTFSNLTKFKYSKRQTLLTCLTLMNLPPEEVACSSIIHVQSRSQHCLRSICVGISIDI